MNGWGVGGDYLGKSENKTIFNIAEGDFFEEVDGGEWKLNYKKKLQIGFGNKPQPLEISGGKILKIIDLDENGVELKINDKQYVNLKYNEELKVNSNITVCDGTNYIYTIKIKKDK